MNAKTPDQLAAEAHQRNEENSEAIVGSAEDTLDGGHQAPLRQGQDDNDDTDRDDGPSKVIPRSPQDDMRSQISARFRRAEPEDERPFNGDMSDTENLYGEFGAEPSDDDEELTDEELDQIAADREALGLPPQDNRKAKPAAQQQQQDQPRMITRKIRGKDVTLSEDEWLERAAQVTAADSYLEEARQVLEQAKEIKAGRASQDDDQHPDRRSQAHAQDGLDQDAVEGAQHPELSFKDVIQEIQYGDPDEAAAKLEKLVDQRSKKTATATVTEGALQRTYDQDLAKSQRQLKEFADANPDLAADERSAMLIEQGMYKGYREDILALGIDASKIPTNPKDLANWHRFYRINGYEVRQTKDLLESSKADLVKWRGGERPQQQPKPSRQQPRIQVNVDRDQRRMAIPVQPQRAVAPRRDAPAPAQTNRSDVVAGMRRARGQV